MEEKSNTRTYHVFVVAFFVCLLLSFSVYFVVGDMLGTEEEAADACYDGSVIEGNDPIHRLLRTVYQNKHSVSRVRRYEYRIFRVVNHENVVAGRNNFLFEIRDTDTGYDFLEDYIGQAAFTEKESEAILSELCRREKYYEEKGAEYLLVVLPNAQTVYSEYMPGYLGSISKNTRLSRLGDYIATHTTADGERFQNFADLTGELRANKGELPLYNNTENTLDALGVYVVYRAVYNRFSPAVRATTRPLTREELTFRQYQTTGKKIAREAGLADTVLNNTVSLSGDTAVNYTYLINTGGLTKTALKPAVAQGQSTSLLLQFSGNWEKLQSEPFFSNTFSRVTYQQGFAADDGIFAKATPTVVIQFLYESELELLLPGEGN